MIYLELILFTPFILLGFIWMKVRFWFGFGMNYEMTRTMKSITEEDVVRYLKQLKETK